MEVELTSLLNIALVATSVIGLIRVLQEKFVQSLYLQAAHPMEYYLLRGSLAVLAAGQITTLMDVPSYSTLVLNMCLATSTYIISKLFD